MPRKMKQNVRGRRLTEEEAAKYRRIRELVADEAPELRRLASRKGQVPSVAIPIFHQEKYP